jgi:hypothetical protein
MNVNKIVCLTLLAAVVWFFFRGIPLEYYDNNLILYSALGGFLFFIFSFQFFGNYNLIKYNTKEATEGKKTAPLMIIPAVVFSIALIFNNGHRKNVILKEVGITTDAIPTGIETTSTTRRFKTTKTKKLELSFRDTSGYKHTTLVDVSQNFLEKLEYGQKVKIVYWMDNPTIAKLHCDIYKENYKNEAILKEHKLISNVAKENERILSKNGEPDTPTVSDRNFTLKDLLVLVDSSKTGEELFERINKINVGWVKEGAVFVNKERGLAVKFEKIGQISYIERYNNSYNYRNPLFTQFENSGFKEVSDNSTNISAYKGKGYKIVYERKISQTIGEAQIIDLVYFVVKD